MNRPATQRFATPLSRRFVFRLFSVLSGVLPAVLLAGCGSHPELGSPEARTTADALYTAVTSRRTELLNEVEKKIALLTQQEKMTPAASEKLTSIITEARAGGWQAAAEDLDALIRSQPKDQHAH